MTPHATDVFYTGATEHRPPAMFCVFNACVPSRSKIVRGVFVAGKMLAFVKERRCLGNQSFKSGSSNDREYSYGSSAVSCGFTKPGETICLPGDCHRVLFACLSSASRLLISSTSRISARADIQGQTPQPLAYHSSEL